MGKELLEEIHATVTKQTAEALRKQSKYLQLSIGEVIDRYVLKFVLNNPQHAVSVLEDYTGMLLIEQSEEFIDKVSFSMMAFFMYIERDLREHNMEDILKHVTDEYSELKEMREGTR